jgi:acyl transferase domain-containing protein
LPFPRRAGVSSFGFGGTNAHVVLEEHSGQNSVLSQSDDLDCLFAISARTPEALRRRVEDLLQWIKEDGAGYSLADISYTLNVGRTHHDCRAVAIAGTIDELLKELGLLLRGKKFHGRAGKDARAGTVDKRKVVEAMAAVQQKRLSANGVYRESLVTLGELYLGGAAVEWRSLYDASHSRRRIELPVYPFSKKRFWLPTKPEIRTLSQVDDVILRGGKMSFDDLLSKRLLTDLEEDKISVEDVINELKQ